MRGGGLALLGRARMRGVDLLADLRDAGPAALAIVGVVNVLIGAILAFVGAAQLRKFAADADAANLVGLAVVREMAAVMTAIVMAGRTGGAYAARIATMQGNEEIDALQVIGIPVSDHILLPAILALVIRMPLLYLYGCLVGMFGGFVVSTAMLNVTAAGYVHQTLDAVPFGQFMFGFLKSIAFAVLIGVTSCRIGLQAGRSDAGCGGGHRRRDRDGRGVRRHRQRSRGLTCRRQAARMLPCCSTRGLKLAFGPKVAQQDLSFDVRRGSIFAVMGGSGCGKSTVLRSMIGLLRPDAGSILVAGEDHWAGSEARRTGIGRRFGVLFQSSALWGSLTSGAR